MNPEDAKRLETEPETNRRDEVIEMHVFDDDAPEEKTLCEADASDDYIRSAMCYLEDRLHGARVGTVCEECKALAAPFAESVADALETDGLADEAAESRRLAGTLRRETAP